MSPTVRSGCHKTVEFGVALTIDTQPKKLGLRTRTDHLPVNSEL